MCGGYVGYPSRWHMDVQPSVSQLRTAQKGPLRLWRGRIFITNQLRESLLGFPVLWGASEEEEGTAPHQPGARMCPRPNRVEEKQMLCQGARRRSHSRSPSEAAGCAGEWCEGLRVHPVVGGDRGTYTERNSFILHGVVDDTQPARGAPWSVGRCQTAAAHVCCTLLMSLVSGAVLTNVCAKGTRTWRAFFRCTRAWRPTSSPTRSTKGSRRCRLGRRFTEVTGGS